MKITRVEKLIVALNCAVPAALLGYDALRGQLGANPVNFAIRTTGMLALTFLVGSLFITPLARLTGWNWLVLFRRTIGLYAFFHAMLHLGIFFVGDRAMNVRSTLSEMVLRPYLIVGSAALLLMVPLAVTSTDGMIRRLGPKRWKLLHRLAYVSAILGVVHYYMLVKADVTRPASFAVALGVLLGFRPVYSLVRLSRMREKTPAIAHVSVQPTGMATAIAPRLLPKFWRGQLRVAGTFDETPNVRTFRLTALDGLTLPFTFLPGQYLNIVLNIDGQTVNRSYTIASSPSRTAYCEITVKRDGVASQFLHRAVQRGDVLTVSAPAGRFTFAGTESPHIVMIAGGVGITPLMSKIRYLTDICWPGDIHLCYAARTAADVIYRDELDYLQRRHSNLHVLTTLTGADAQTTPGPRGRLTAQQVIAHAPHIRESVVHICGPDAMLEPTRQLLRELGVPEDRIHFESFTSPGRDVAGMEEVADASPLIAGTAEPSIISPAASTDGAAVTFARSGRVGVASTNQSVLEVAEATGVNIDFDCRSGICGQCKVNLIGGQVEMTTQDALSASDRAKGYVLACQAHCVGPVTIDA